MVFFGTTTSKFGNTLDSHECNSSFFTMQDFASQTKLTSLLSSKNLKLTFKKLLNIFHERKMVIDQAKKCKGKKNKSYHVQCLKAFVKIQSKKPH